MNNIAKVEFYDAFNCTADRCSFTCCEGWEIIVDQDTYSKWKSNPDQADYICKNVKKKKNGNTTERYIKMGPQMRCLFLNEKKLCNLVIQYGESYLSSTCKAFPRQESNFGKLKEYSLSCACPAVIDIINELDGKIKFLSEKETDCSNFLPVGYTIRQAMIIIMQRQSFSLNNRILLVFDMLLSIKMTQEISDEVRSEEVRSQEVISRYLKEDKTASIVHIWSEIEKDNEDSCIEIRELFLDIVENYRKVNNFSVYLREIAEVAEDFESEACQRDAQTIHAEWNEFKAVWIEYEKLIENCMTTKIFSNCISDDIDEMIMSFQIIITEYVMVKYSAFLKWIINEKKAIAYCDIRDYIVIYSRIIGYNSEGIIEFWEESFDDAVWELGYMALLIH